MPRHLLTLLVLGWSLTLLVVALTVFLPPGSWLALVVLLALRFVFGGFQAGVFPGLARVVADWMPAQQRGFAQGSIWTFSRARRRVAPVFVVWLITQVFGSKGSPGLARFGDHADRGARPGLECAASGSGFAIGPKKCRSSTRPSAKLIVRQPARRRRRRPARCPGWRCWRRPASGDCA